MDEIVQEITQRIHDADARRATAPVGDILRWVLSLIEATDLPAWYDRDLTSTEAAELEGICPRTITLRCNAGEYPGAYRTQGDRGRWRIPLSALAKRRRILAGRTVSGDQPPLAEVQSFLVEAT